MRAGPAESDSERLGSRYLTCSSRRTLPFRLDALEGVQAYHLKMLRVLLTSMAMLVLLLTGCTGAGFTFGVDDFSIPADSTAGTICWVQVSNGSRVGVRAATFEAQATYRQGDSLIATDDQAVIEVFGRDAAPSGTCVPGSADDVKLGGPYTLTVDEAEQIRIGEGGSGAELARLANQGTYWLGARLASGFQIGGEQTITFENGRIRVWF